MDIVRHHLCLLVNRDGQLPVDKQRRIKTEREMGLSSLGKVGSLTVYLFVGGCLDTGTQMNVLMHHMLKLGGDEKEQLKPNDHRRRWR